MNEGKHQSNTMKIVAWCSIGFVFLLITIGSLSGNSSSSKKTESQTTKVQKATANELTDWFKNKYSDETRAEFEKSGQQYDGSRDQLMAVCISGFKEQNGELYVNIDNNQLKAEGFTQKEVANYAFNVVYTSYRGDTAKAKFENLNKDGSLSDEVIKKPLYYSEVV